VPGETVGAVAARSSEPACAAAPVHGFRRRRFHGDFV